MPPYRGTIFPVLCVFLFRVMAENTVNQKSENFRRYREYLDKQIILLTEKYHLPDINGAEKQIPWANDVRIKFVIQFDKHFAELPGDVCAAVQKTVLAQTSARWWIDHKDASYDEMLRLASVLGSISQQVIPGCESAAPVQSKPAVLKAPVVDMVIIDTQDVDKITVQYSRPEKLSEVLTPREFVFDSGSGVWVKTIEQTDNARTGVVESICLSFLSRGYAARVIAPPEPPVKHDGYLECINGRLCVVANTEPVYKAAARLGSRLIWFEGVDVSDIRGFVKAYDIEVSEAAQELIGDAGK